MSTPDRIHVDRIHVDAEKRKLSFQAQTITSVKIDIEKKRESAYNVSAVEPLTDKYEFVDTFAFTGDDTKILQIFCKSGEHIIYKWQYTHAGKPRPFGNHSGSWGEKTPIITEEFLETVKLCLLEECQSAQQISERKKQSYIQTEQYPWRYKRGVSLRKVHLWGTRKISE